MFFSDLINRGTTPALDATLSFTQANHRVLAENIANIDNPEYQAKHLDPKEFQRTLRSALTARAEQQGKSLEIQGTRQLEQDADGRITFKPTVEPADNVLFHDGTNARIEKQMSLLAENAMMHQAATELLSSKFDGLLKAIRGRAS